MSASPDHPIFDPRSLAFDTPPLKTLESGLYQLLWNGATGVFVVGPARSGKTTALRKILSRLLDRSSTPIPSVFFTTARRDSPTLHSLHTALCQQFDIWVRSRDTPAHMAKRMASHLRETAIKAGTRRIALCVDDAHKLRIEQWDVFSEITTYLEYEPRIQLSIISVLDAHFSQPLLEAFTRPKYSYLRGRYMNRILEFRGIGSQRELRGVLSSYDKQEYPENSGTSFTAAVLPDDFANGWRLADQANLLWDAFRESRRIGEPTAWGMQSVIDTVQILLLDYMAMDGVEILDEDLVLHCLTQVSPDV